MTLILVHRLYFFWLLLIDTNPCITTHKTWCFGDVLNHSSRRVQGCYRCSGCVTCSYLTTGNSYTITNTSRTYVIKHFVFSLCHLPSNMPVRTQIYWQNYLWVTPEIRNKNNKPIARHMLSSNPNDTLAVRFMGIDLIPRFIRWGDLHRLILQWEWTFHLNTVFQNGLNEQINFGCFTSMILFILSNILILVNI